MNLRRITLSFNLDKENSSLVFDFLEMLGGQKTRLIYQLLDAYIKENNIDLTNLTLGQINEIKQNIRSSSSSFSLGGGASSPSAFSPKIREEKQEKEEENKALAKVLLEEEDKKQEEESPLPIEEAPTDVDEDIDEDVDDIDDDLFGQLGAFV